jgi:hypothetical protein
MIDKGALVVTHSGRHPWDANDPYPEDTAEEDVCWHEEYEADILTGTARCCSCNHSWHQTSEEIKREREAQIAWDKQCEEWEKNPPPPAPSPSTGDDIPF